MHNVYQGIKDENIADESDWLFRRFSPDEPMSIEDKIEYQGFINKLYKKIIPFLKEDKHEDNIQEEIKVPVQSEKKLLNSEVREALKLQEDVRWEDIELIFENEFIVELRANARKYESNYEEMGFADNRKNSEDEAKYKSGWSQLIIFSVCNNIFDYKNLTIQEKSKFKKKKQQLSKLLKKYFQIDDDPIIYNKEAGTYRMRMKLVPEKVFQEQWEDRNIRDQQI